MPRPADGNGPGAGRIRFCGPAYGAFRTVRSTRGMRRADPPAWYDASCPAAYTTVSREWDVDDLLDREGRYRFVGPMPVPATAAVRLVFGPKARYAPTCTNHAPDRTTAVIRNGKPPAGRDIRRAGSIAIHDTNALVDPLQNRRLGHFIPEGFHLFDFFADAMLPHTGPHLTGGQYLPDRPNPAIS